MADVPNSTSGVELDSEGMLFMYASYFDSNLDESHIYWNARLMGHKRPLKLKRSTSDFII